MNRYILNVLVGIDQLANAIFGGDPDETISSALGKTKLHYNGKIPWRRPFAKCASWLCDSIQRNHCRNAIESDEGKDAIAKDDK